MIGEGETAVSPEGQTTELSLHEQFPKYLKWREKNKRKIHFSYSRR